MPELKKTILYKTATMVIFFITLVAVFNIGQPHVLAQVTPSLGIEYGSSINLGTRDIREIIMSAVQIMLGFLGVIAVCIVLYGGWLWMTSQGESDKIEKAKKVLINGAIGLLIIMMAYAIVWFIARQVSTIFNGQNGPGQGNTPFYGGALGGGVLEAVYPEPGATGVPRNTLIMVMFNEEMDVDTIIEPNSRIATQGCNSVPAIIPCGRIAGNLTDPNVKIKNNETDLTLEADDVTVIGSANNKNYVFDPVQYLGNADNFSYYSVNLTDNILRANGMNAFLQNGYTWSFQVSNVLDLDPPHVTEVIPRTQPGDPTYMNAVVQINFNEAMNIVGATMWENISPFYANNTKIVGGNLIVSNLFKTVEFISNEQCEINGVPVINSCGTTPFCLPGLETITTLIKAAMVDPLTHETINPLSGITDAAGNSLDGGEDNANTSNVCTPSGCSHNGVADGRPDSPIPPSLTDPQVQTYFTTLTDVSVPNDNYWWVFDTNDEMDLTPPFLVETPSNAPSGQQSLDPKDEEMLVPKNQYVKAMFSEWMMSSTLTSSNYKIFNQRLCPLTPLNACGNMADAQDWPDEINSCDANAPGTCIYPRGGFVVYKQNYNDVPTISFGILPHATKVYIKTYYPYLDGLEWYNSRTTSEMKDSFQNCFNPASGPAPVTPPNHTLP